MKALSRLLLLSSVVGWLSLIANAQSVHFVKDWETKLYPEDVHGDVRVCVDSLHNVQVITSDGLWSTLDPSGKVIRQTNEDKTIRGAISLFCVPSQERIVVGVLGTHQVYLFSSSHERISSIAVSDGFRAVVSADDKSIRLLAPREGHLFRDVDLKTGAVIGTPGSLTEDTDVLRRERGETFVDEKGGFLLFVTHNPETVSQFDSQGNLMFSRKIVGDVRQRDSSQSVSVPGAPLTNDLAFGLFRIAGNRYLVNISRVDVTADRSMTTGELEYQILDGQLNILGYASAEGIGSVLASDGHGVIYGLSRWHGQNVVRAHLQ